MPISIRVAARSPVKSDRANRAKPSLLDAEPLRLRIAAESELEKNSDLLLDQLRAIDNKRLVQGPLLQCTSEFMSRVDQALIEVLDILFFS